MKKLSARKRFPTNFVKHIKATERGDLPVPTWRRMCRMKPQKRISHSEIFQARIHEDPIEGFAEINRRAVAVSRYEKTFKSKYPDSDPEDIIQCIESCMTPGSEDQIIRIEYLRKVKNAYVEKGLKEKEAGFHMPPKSPKLFSFVAGKKPQRYVCLQSNGSVLQKVKQVGKRLRKEVEDLVKFCLDLPARSTRSGRAY